MKMITGKMVRKGNGEGQVIGKGPVIVLPLNFENDLSLLTVP